MEYTVGVVTAAVVTSGLVWAARRAGLGWKRSAACAGCHRRTVQLLHGHTPDGRLWKGHVYMCRGWECSRCRHLNQARRPCCR